MKDNKRSQRMHHKKRLKDKRKKYLINTHYEDTGYVQGTDPRWIGIISETPKVCNCWMCSKPKKHVASISEIRETQPKLFEDNE
jgi:hypothetical protein